MLEAPLAGRTIGSADGSFVLAEWADEGGTSRDRPIAPLHLHHGEDEAWYVLEGTLRFRVGAEEVAANSGDAVLVPRGTAHTYWNASTGTTRYLLVMGPKTTRLVEAIHSTDARDQDSMKALFRDHDTELLV